MNQETLLTLGKVGLPPYSARACIQTLYPVTQPSLFRRTLNGVLHYIGDTLHHKYGSTIRSQDAAVVALEPLWCGHVLDVGCILPITQTVSLENPKVQLSRPAVSDSIYVYDHTSKIVAYKMRDAQNLVLTLDHIDLSHPLFVTYRPQLRMMVCYFSYTLDEWGLKTDWTLKMEEI